MKTVPAMIYDAINDEDVNAIEDLFLKNPEFLNTHTFMAGQTWLGFAAQAGKFRSVEKLIEMGSDPNIGDETHGAKPICSACNNGHPEIVKFLIDHESDLDADTSVKNPLFAAVVGHSPECVRIVLNAGIDSTIRYNSDTMDNMDALSFALMRGEHECAEIIARWNANGDELAVTHALQEADVMAARNAHKDERDSLS